MMMTLGSLKYYSHQTAVILQFIYDYLNKQKNSESAHRYVFELV